MADYARCRYKTVNNKMQSLPKGTLKSFNTIQCNKCNDRTSTEADRRVTYASQGSLLKEGQVLKEEQESD